MSYTTIGTKLANDHEAAVNLLERFRKQTAAQAKAWEEIDGALDNLELGAKQLQLGIAMLREGIRNNIRPGQAADNAAREAELLAIIGEPEQQHAAE